MHEFYQDNCRTTQKIRPSCGMVLSSAGRTSENKIYKTDRENTESEDSSERLSQKKLVAANATKNTRKPDRDLRRFKIRYNMGIGNIMRNWMSLMYSILILRVNLIKFIFDQLPDKQMKNKQLSQQILLEGKIIYHIIRKAQHFSHERALFFWTHLEKLIINRIILKMYLETTRRKEFSCKDWKGMAARLESMQAEFEKVQNSFNAIMEERVEKEKMLTSKVESLENLSRSKDELLEQLIDQVMHLKKGELEASCQIISHLKTFRDLSKRKKELLNMEKEVKQLKNDQEQMVKDFLSKVKALRYGIIEKDNEIKMEKKERRKLKKTLKEFGHVEPAV